MNLKKYFAFLFPFALLMAMTSTSLADNSTNCFVTITATSSDPTLQSSLSLNKIYDLGAPLLFGKNYTETSNRNKADYILTLNIKKSQRPGETLAIDTIELYDVFSEANIVSEVRPDRLPKCPSSEN